MNNTPSPFAGEYPGHTFSFFSASHLSALLALFLLYIVLWYFRDWFKSPRIDRRARWIIAGLLILQ